MQNTNGEKFVEFNYAELKDLGKHFLTISSASLVIVLTFFEKYATSNCFEQSLTKRIKIGGILLIISVISAGIGLFTNYIAGCGASNSMIWSVGKNYRNFTKITYILYMIAGFSLILGYLSLLKFVGNN
jgi:hypothetical protein